MMRRIEYILGVAALSLALGSLAWLDKTPSGRSLPMEPMAAVPAWITSGSCVPMNAEERAQARLALQVLENSPSST